MKTTSLKEYEEFVKKGIAYVPLGTIEWHGNHLPIETDFMVAEKICRILAEKYEGYVLPPIYLGAYGTKIIDGKELRGMDKRLGKALLGNLYFVKPDLFKEIILSVVQNLEDQGFKKVIIVTGHGGSNQVAKLTEIAEGDEKVLFINPYEMTDHIAHADEGETSLLWACHPEEEAKSRAVTLTEDDDFVNFHGSDPLEKSSLELGKKHLDKMVNGSEEKMEEFLK